MASPLAMVVKEALTPTMNCVIELQALMNSVHCDRAVTLRDSSTIFCKGEHARLLRHGVRNGASKDHQSSVHYFKPATSLPYKKGKVYGMA